MANLLAWGLCVVLAGIAALHAYWALGGMWPGRDPVTLARTVLGGHDPRAMPPRPTIWAVAAMLLAAGLWPLLKVGALPAPVSAGWARMGLPWLGAVFVLRGLAAYLPPWRRRHRVEPFATLDRRFYGPLCLCLGAGFWALWWL